MATQPSRILVVDDDADLRLLLSDYLRREGYEVSAVEDGAAMHAWLAQETADLLILDLMLPGEDGLTLARQLRKDSQVERVTHNVLNRFLRRL